MRHIAFVLDPDDYWVCLDVNYHAANPAEIIQVEIIGQKPLEQTETLRETNMRTYRFVRPKLLNLYLNIERLSLKQS